MSAKPTKQTKQGKGRPTRYHPAYAAQARDLCAEYGATDARLATLFGVGKATIHRWHKDHADFADACQTGRDSYNSAEIEACLFKRAKGYKITEVTKEPVLVSVAGESAPRLVGELRVTKTVTKHVLPDIGAIKFVLTNRKPDRWRDRQEVKHSGEVDLVHQLPAPVHDLLAVIFGTAGSDTAQEATA